MHRTRWFRRGRTGAPGRAALALALTLVAGAGTGADVLARANAAGAPSATDAPASRADVDEAALRALLRRRARRRATDYRTPPIYAADSAGTAGGSSPSPERGRAAHAAASRGGHEGAHAAALRPFGYDAFSDPAGAFADADEAVVPPDYTLGPGDHVLVEVWGRVEKSYELTIDREGGVFIPAVGRVALWGLTVDAAGERIHQALSRVYSGIESSVTLGRIRSIRVYVFGAVERPGTYTVPALATLFNVLYRAGGPAPNGSLRRIRHTRGGRMLATVDLYDALARGRSVDRRLADGDVVFVPVAGATAAVRGCVRRPAVYELLGGETVGDVIALAGGVGADARLDRVVVRRIDPRLGHTLVRLDLTHGADSSFAVADGDTIDVRAVYRELARFVEIAGEVRYPGRTQWRPGMRVSDLVRGQLTIRSYLDRANLLRTESDYTRRLIAVDLSAVLAGDSTADIELHNRDHLRVYAVDDVRRVPYVSIEGEVVREDRYELTRGMRLSDLVFLAGGPRKNAWLLEAEIARVGPKGYSEIIRADLRACLEHPGGPDDIELVEDDRVFIREIPEWNLQDMVRVEGEVRFPGRYALRRRNETLSEVIARAGGFTDDAFLPGAVFERASIAQDIRRRNIPGILENLQDVTLDTLQARVQESQLRLLSHANVSRVVVDLVGLFERGERDKDIALRGGDRIFIPPRPSGVHVMGAVASAGTIKYAPGRRLRYYVQAAGGLLRSADRGEIRIVRPDGRVIKDDVDDVVVGLGDTIVIPRRIRRDHDWWKTITNTVTVVTSALTMVYMVTRL